jgi:4-carboxymuconolactone decarboxylase
MSEETYETGNTIRRAVLGDEYVDRGAARPGDFHEEFQRYVTEACWGACWGRDGIERPTRSLFVLSILGALGRWEEFELHFRGALRNGCTQEELKDTLFHIAVYAGVPAGVSAFKIARRVLAEVEAAGPAS